jgi:hypothetical protein
MEHPTRRLDDSEQRGSYFGHNPDPCPRCQQPRIWTWASAPTSPRIQLYRVVSAPGLVGERRVVKGTDCAALMCIECGYTELYAQKPEDLLEP